MYLWIKHNLKTYNRHLQRWCWGSFLPAPASLSSGCSSQLLLGSACRPGEGNSYWVYSQKCRPVARSVNQLESLKSLKRLVSSKQGMLRQANWNMSSANTQNEYLLQVFGDSNRKIKCCFSREQHLISNEGQEEATTRCVGGDVTIWGWFQMGLVCQYGRPQGTRCGFSLSSYHPYVYLIRPKQNEE